MTADRDPGAAAAPRTDPRPSRENEELWRIASRTWNDVYHELRAEGVSESHAMARADIVRIELEKRLDRLGATESGASPAAEDRGLAALREALEAVYATFVRTLPSTGMLGRARTRRPAIGIVEACRWLRQVIDETPLSSDAPVDRDRRAMAALAALSLVVDRDNLDAYSPVVQDAYRYALSATSTPSTDRTQALIDENRQLIADRDALRAELAALPHGEPARTPPAISEEEQVIRDWLAGQVNPNTGGPLSPSKRLSEPLPRRRVPAVVAALIDIIDAMREPARTAGDPRVAALEAALREAPSALELHRYRLIGASRDFDWQRMYRDRLAALSEASSVREPGGEGPE